MKITNSKAINLYVCNEKKIEDWHNSEIIAALRKEGITLAALSRKSGLRSGTLANAMARPWPKGEFIIGDALNLHPAEIWPSRYFDEERNLIDRNALIRESRGKE